MTWLTARRGVRSPQRQCQRCGSDETFLDQVGVLLEGADRVLVTTVDFAYRRPDGVAVVPLALLGP